MDAKLPSISKKLYTSLNENLDLTMIVIHAKIMVIWQSSTIIYNTMNWPSSKYVHLHQLCEFGSFEWKIGCHDCFY
jgi:hypothetical protein